MAQRRMFSLKIVGSDPFLDLPVSSRELYFQLGMHGDDDGFVNPQKIMRMVGASKNDLDALLSKRFILLCDGGVVVVKHWKINNMIRKDFYQPTMYQEAKARLIIKDNGSYTESLQIVNKMSPQLSIGKDSIGKVNKRTQELKHTILENLSFSTKEYYKLKTLYGRPGWRWIIAKLSSYKLAHGKNYKSDYGAVNQWVADAYKQVNETKTEKRITTAAELEAKYGNKK